MALVTLNDDNQLCMKYLRTKLGTGYGNAAPPSSIGSQLIAKLEAILDRFNSNPGYNHSDVHEWLIEFGDDNYPWRELGIDLNGKVVIKGPDERNYGYWLDTNMGFSDFVGVQITPEEFETQWNSEKSDI